MRQFGSVRQCSSLAVWGSGALSHGTRILDSANAPIISHLAVPHNNSCLDDSCTLVQVVDGKCKMNRRFIDSFFPQQPILIGKLLLCVGRG